MGPASAAAVITDDEDSGDPYRYQHLASSIPYPKSLSPSSTTEFKECLQSFLLQRLWGIRQPTTPVLARYSMCHAALKQIFNLEPDDRTLEKLQDLYRKEWDIEKQHESYKALFLNEGEEREWVFSGLRLLQNYVELEDPRQIASPNPVKRVVVKIVTRVVLLPGGTIHFSSAVLWIT
ncbi:hypothetical protein MHU86_12132 [Fragilaria crotonensis]|nr:hypothetical protein MHU86_12132 [Fragilaria crotonensis]